MEGETADAPVTLQTLIDEFQRLVNLKADTTLIEKPSGSKQAVHAVSEKKEHQSQRPPKPKGKPLPSTPCWQCGQVHYVRDCPFSDHRCKTCDRVGHKEGYCGCIKKSPGGDSSPAHPTAKKPTKKKQKHYGGSSSRTRGVSVHQLVVGKGSITATQCKLISFSTWFCFLHSRKGLIVGGGYQSKYVVSLRSVSSSGGGGGGGSNANHQPLVAAWQ
nr:uncharacterized protein LOC115266884 [Aedes albopictus]